MTTEEKISEKELAELERLDGEATQGDWMLAEHVGLPQTMVSVRRPRRSLLGIRVIDNTSFAEIESEADAKLVVAARNSLMKLVAEVRRLRERVSTLESAAKTAVFCLAEHVDFDGEKAREVLRTALLEDGE